MWAGLPLRSDAGRLGALGGPICQSDGELLDDSRNQGRWAALTRSRARARKALRSAGPCSAAA